MGDIENNQILNEINKKFNTNNVVTKSNRTPESGISLTSNRSVNIRLEDGITLSIIKSNSESRVKKFFHLPNFEIYSIKEIPMSSKFFISNFREKLSYWLNKVGGSNKFIKIYNEYVNSPEG
jgi:hypothetical protein